MKTLLSFVFIALCLGMMFHFAFGVPERYTFYDAILPALFLAWVLRRARRLPAKLGV